jgi:hypothetical protein
MQIVNLEFGDRVFISRNLTSADGLWFSLWRSQVGVVDSGTIGLPGATTPARRDRFQRISEHQILTTRIARDRHCYFPE